MMSPDEPYDLVIRGGTVVVPGGPAQLEIGIRQGRIASLGQGLPAGLSEIDATNRLVLPGGIDSHCHMDQQPWEGRSSADDFRISLLDSM